MDFSLLRWELVVAGLALLILFLDLFATTLSKKTIGYMAVGGLFSALAWSLFLGNGMPSGLESALTASGLFLLDPLAVWAKQFFMLATALTILMSIRSFETQNENLSEHIFLQLVGCLAMMLLSSTTDFFSLFVSLELLTVVSYVLVAFRRRNALSLEAGLKYLIYGALSSGILLYGIALIYGETGQYRFAQISQSLPLPFHSGSMLTGLGLMLVLTGIGFKISAVPFHWWTPDVYEGAPTPTTAFLAISSKAAGFVALVRVLEHAFPGWESMWIPIIQALAAASILWGNLGALSQSNLKRLMGYSSISHTGYMLLGVCAASLIGLSSILFYLLGYLLANSLVFGVMCETSVSNPRQDIMKYTGFGKRSSLAAGALTLGLLSLAGIPPLAGFFGKLLLFNSVLERNMWILIILSVIGVICSFYYYLGVLRTVYFAESTHSDSNHLPDRMTRWVFRIQMVMLIGIGFYQAPWWNSAVNAFRFLHR